MKNQTFQFVPSSSVLISILPNRMKCSDISAHINELGGYFLASTGSIIFRVYTSNAQIPVEGATVVVRQQNDPGKLLGIRITDESGQTDPLIVATKDVSLGQTPENLVQPWVGCIVYVEHPEYEKVLLYGVQIFPGVNTVQNIQLIPLQELDPDLDQEQRFDITPQPIWEGPANE